MRRLSLVLLILAFAQLAGVAPAVAQTVVRYDPPVPGAVLQPFAEPAHAYAPGHRGVDLATRLGDPVHTAAGGEVTFAGTVGRARWVTVRHADGIRTSYGELDEIRVRVGDTVTRGQVIATATGSNGDILRPEPGLHWSARRGETYLDPLTLVDAPLPRPTLVGAGGWAGSHPVVEPYERYPGGSNLWIIATPSPEAEAPGWVLPPNHHHLLQVPGYGTEGPHPVLDPTFLGYGPDDSSVFSYRGCEPIPNGCDPRPYGGQDTDVGIDEAAALLDQHLRAQQRAQPHRPVDLIGHSMGGDLITHYLTFVYDPSDPQLPPIGNMATIAAPHGGSGTASLARAVGADALLGNIAESLRIGLHAVGVDAVGRVSFGSEPLARYGVPVWGDRPARDPERLARLGIPVLEIAGSRDMVVGRTDAGSSTHALVLPGGHTSVTETQAIHETIYRFLDGRPLPQVDSRVGWGADAMSDVGRILGTIVDIWPGRSVARALDAGDAGRVLNETGRQVVGGPARQHGDGSWEEPIAPDPPLDQLDPLP